MLQAFLLFLHNWFTVSFAPARDVRKSTARTMLFHLPVFHGYRHGALPHATTLKQW